jgi:hypothetical protein
MMMMMIIIIIIIIIITSTRANNLHLATIKYLINEPLFMYLKL